MLGTSFGWSPLTFLEAFRVLWFEMEPILKDVDGFQVDKADVGRWVEERKDNLAKLRNAVAHPNTTWVRAIDESGYGEPVLMLGLASPDTLQSTLDEHLEYERAAFSVRDSQLRTATAFSLGNADAYCAKLADFLAKVNPLADSAEVQL